MRHTLQHLGLSQDEVLKWVYAVAYEVTAAFGVYIKLDELIVQVVPTIEGKSVISEGALRYGNRHQPSILFLTKHVISDYPFSRILFIILHEVGHFLDFRGLINLPSLYRVRSPSIYKLLFDKRRAEEMKHRIYMHSRSEVRANAVAWIVCIQLPVLTAGRFWLHKQSPYLNSDAVEEFESLVAELAAIYSIKLPWA